MTVLEDKLTSAILGSIRVKRQRPRNSAPLRNQPSGAAPNLREARFSDFDGVMSLRQRAGWSADSIENWHRLWASNPALEYVSSQTPIGWVLEVQGRVVGYLGNIALTYRYGQRTLSAVTGTGLVADPEYRAATLSMNAAFYGQGAVDLFLTTTAVEAVGKIARAFKASPLPQPEYDSMLFWVLEPKEFAEVVAKKLELRRSLSGLAAGLSAVGLSADRVLRRRWPSVEAVAGEIREIKVAEMGDEFDALWAEKLTEAPRLLASRDSATLRWHFEVPGDKGAARVLCHYLHGKLAGYAVVRHEAACEKTGLRRSVIADMVALNDDPSVLRSLWAAAYHQSKEAGSHIFEVLGFPVEVRKLCLPWRPYVRKYPACPFFYKAADPSLHQMLANGDLWYASPFDGDTTLWAFGS